MVSYLLIRMREDGEYRVQVARWRSLRARGLHMTQRSTVEPFDLELDKSAGTGKSHIHFPQRKIFNILKTLWFFGAPHHTFHVGMAWRLYSNQIKRHFKNWPPTCQLHIRIQLVFQSTLQINTRINQPHYRNIIGFGSQSTLGDMDALFLQGNTLTLANLARTVDIPSAP